MARNPRRETPTVWVGNVPIGSCHPIVVQSMTNTDTAEASATADQVAELARAGSELVRITVNTKQAAASVPEIRSRLDDRGVRVPLVGDFHYNGHLLLSEFPDCARALDKYRINPGNVGAGRHQDANFQRIVEIAREEGKPVRIGVNWGSLDQALLTELMDENAASPDPVEATAVTHRTLVESALRSAERAEAHGLPRDHILLSAKVSRVQDLVAVYRILARRSNYPLHLGLTEAGMGMKGVVASTAALSVLLQEGIGDTIRVSLTPAPGGDRREEVEACQHILQALEIRHFSPLVTACPGCGRTTSAFFQELAGDIETHMKARLTGWKEKHPGVEELQVAVMGCVVNGPGESKHADVGISLPGTGEAPRAPVYVDGKHRATLEGETLVEDFLALLDAYVAERFGS